MSRISLFLLHLTNIKCHRERSIIYATRLIEDSKEKIMKVRDISIYGSGNNIFITKTLQTMRLDDNTFDEIKRQESIFISTNKDSRMLDNSIKKNERHIWILFSNYKIYNFNIDEENLVISEGYMFSKCDNITIDVATFILLRLLSAIPIMVITYILYMMI